MIDRTILGFREESGLVLIASAQQQFEALGGVRPWWRGSGKVGAYFGEVW